MIFKPHAYQSEAIQWGLDHKKCGLLLPMGAGKTVSTLTIIHQLMYIEVSKVLIIGPVRVIQSTWPDEICQWEHTKDLTYTIIDGPMAKGKNPIKFGTDLYLIGKENLAALIETYQRNWPFDMVVIDELSTFKNPQSKRFKALRKMMPLVDRFIGLTGTPAPNGLPDLWSQIYLMDRGERLGKTLSAFRGRFLKPGRRNGYVVYEWNLQDGAEEEIYKRIGDICMSIKQGDCTKLPPLTVIDYPVDLKKAKRGYDQFKRDKLLELGDDEAIIAANAGVLCGQLLQYASGEIYTSVDNYTEVGIERTHEIHNHKLDALDDLIESANGQSVMVFYYFKHELDRLTNHFVEANKKVRTIKKPEDVRDWNNGEIDILLLHPASAGHGLNLQRGGNIAIWYTLPNWNLELYQQANARIYRQGQQKAVTIYHLMAKGTIDEDMIEALNKKDVTQKRLIEALRKEN